MRSLQSHTQGFSDFFTQLPRSRLSSQSSGFLGSTPASRIGPFDGPMTTLESMGRLALGARGEQSALVRQFTEAAVRDVFPKDYLGEIIAVRNILIQPSPVRGPSTMFRYLNDPRHVEWIKDPQRQVEEIRQFGNTVVDCDEQSIMAATMGMQLGREVEFVAMGFSPRQLTHVATRIKEPKSGQWIFVDPVAGPRESEAPRKAAEVLFYSLD